MAQTENSDKDIKSAINAAAQRFKEWQETYGQVELDSYEWVQAIVIILALDAYITINLGNQGSIFNHVTSLDQILKSTYEDGCPFESIISQYISTKAGVDWGDSLCAIFKDERFMKLGQESYKVVNKSIEDFKAGLTPQEREKYEEMYQQQRAETYEKHKTLALQFMAENQAATRPQETIAQQLQRKKNEQALNLQLYQQDRQFSWNKYRQGTNAFFRGVLQTGVNGEESYANQMARRQAQAPYSFVPQVSNLSHVNYSQVEPNENMKELALQYEQAALGTGTEGAGSENAAGAGAGSAAPTTTSSSWSTTTSMPSSGVTVARMPSYRQNDAQIVGQIASRTNSLRNMIRMARELNINSTQKDRVVRKLMERYQEGGKKTMRRKKMKKTKKGKTRRHA